MRDHISLNEQRRWDRLGAFSPEQWNDYGYLLTVANTLRLALERPDWVELTLDALYGLIEELAE